MEGFRLFDTNKRDITNGYVNSKQLIFKLESVYKLAKYPLPKRDRLQNNFFKYLREFLQTKFEALFPDFNKASNTEKKNDFNSKLTAFAHHLLENSIQHIDNESLYKGKWGGFEFLFGSIISRETMKQMITSSKEKAYFYNLQK